MKAYIEEQKLLCEEFDSAYVVVNADDLVAVAIESLKQDPIVGIRKLPEAGETVAWYIYGGELDLEQDSFETISVAELEKLNPDLIPYLALETGFRFMIDQDEYEDVWRADQA